MAQERKGRLVQAMSLRGEKGGLRKYYHRQEGGVVGGEAERWVDAVGRSVQALF